MSTKILFALILLSTCIQASEKPSLEVNVTEVPAARLEGMTKYSIEAADGSMPALQIELPAGMRTRIAAVHATKNRILLVVQFDEFYLEISEYKLDGKTWIPHVQERICSLDGYLARTLQQVKIGSGDVVEVTFSKEVHVGKKPGGWKRELLDQKETVIPEPIVENYNRDAENHWHVTGAKHPLRVKQERGGH